MKAIKNILIVYLLLLAVSETVFAQDYMQDMQKICANLKDKDISFHIRYLFYPYDSVKKAVDSMKIACYMSNNEYYDKITSGTISYEYIKNSKYFFVVDNDESAIAVRKCTDAKREMWDISALDSLIRNPSVKVTYKTKGNNEVEYTMKFADAIWNRISIIFNKSTYRLSSVHMYSDERGKMYGTPYKRPVIAVFYSDYTEKQVSKTLFSEGKYFSDTQHSIELSDSYKKYKLLDYVYKLKSKS